MVHHCSVWNIFKTCRFDVIRLWVLGVYMDLLLQKESDIAELRRLANSFLGAIAFYPERRKVVIYLFGYKFILWVSIDEVGNHAV